MTESMRHLKHCRKLSKHYEEQMKQPQEDLEIIETDLAQSPNLQVLVDSISETKSEISNVSHKERLSNKSSLSMMKLQMELIKSFDEI